MTRQLAHPRLGEARLDEGVMDIALPRGQKSGAVVGEVIEVRAGHDGRS